MDKVWAVLKQRSTMVGLVGLGGALLSLIGVDLDAEQQILTIEILLGVVSVVAIATQPKEKWDGRTDRRGRGSSGSAGGLADDGEIAVREAQGGREKAQRGSGSVQGEP